MKTAFTTFLILLISFTTFANDGVYLTSGGIIYPTKESKIILEKEILSFTCINKVAQVNILFEFNNPENVERTLLIGFQAPTSAGDVTDEECNTVQISNFTILQNNQILPYTLKAAECESCELKDPKEFHFNQSEQGVYVYLFEVTFKPGINKINHSYQFPASSNVSINQIYNYILTTGAKWANSNIKDLTVQINMGENKYFYVDDIFGDKAVWSIIGSGKVTNQTFFNGDDFKPKMIRVLAGALQISVKDFKPTQNIEFGIIDQLSFISPPTDYTNLENGKVIGLGDFSLLDKTDYTKQELKIMRNTIYAQYGYAFNSQELKDYFNQFAWYIANPNINMEDIKLTEREKAFVTEILKKEKE